MQKSHRLAQVKLPQTVTNVVSVLNADALLLLLHLLGAHLEHSDQTWVLLALGFDYNNFASLQILASVVVNSRIFIARQSSAGARQAGNHECCATHHETDSSSVDAHALEGPGVFVYDGQVGDDRIVHVLPEQRCVAVAVEGDAVGDLDEV